MCRPEALSAWIAELASVFTDLSKPQVKVLAEYSLGMALAGRCGLSCVAFALAQWLGQGFDAVRERLRDWYCGASDKSGAGRSKPLKRRELDVEGCFAPLLAWVLRDWSGEHLAIALDATTLGQRFVVLAVSVVYRSSAIPVAWVVLPACAKGAWTPHWLALLQCFKDMVPPHLKVIVLADRGLYAKWLFEAVVALGWHPFLRVNTNNAEFRPEGTEGAEGAEGVGPYLPLKGLLPNVGSSYDARGTMFRSAKARLRCTLLARWDEGYEGGWFVLTDLPPEQAACVWYGLRGWIERGFKHTKSGGWNWQETRMEDPDRAARQWLAMAVATVFLMRQGAAQEIQEAQEMQEAQETPEVQGQPQDRTYDSRDSIPAPPPSAQRPGPSKDKPPKDKPSKDGQPPAPPRTTCDPAPPTARARKPRRVLSVFRMGLLIVQATLLANLPFPHGRFVPEPWPPSTPAQPPHPTPVQPP